MKNIPKVKASKIVYDQFFSLREDLLERSDGFSLPYTTLICVDAVAVLAQDLEGRWIINREYRHAAGQILLGCPGGRLEPGEDPITGGKRELLEETGYGSDEAVLIGCCHPFPGVCNQKIHYLWVKNAVKKGSQKLDPFECIEPQAFDDAELRRHIRSGTAIDGVLLTALWYKDHFQG